MKLHGKVLSSAAALCYGIVRGERPPFHPQRTVSWSSKSYGSGQSQLSSSAVAAAFSSSTPMLLSSSSSSPSPPPPSSSTRGEAEPLKGDPSTNEHGPSTGTATTPPPPPAAAATTRTGAAPRRLLAQRLSSSISNVTRALLPLAPFIVEAPALTAHARAAWPWAQEVLATAVNKACFVRRPPFAFVTSPSSLRPGPQHRQERQLRQQMQQQQRGGEARGRNVRRRRRSRRARHEGEQRDREARSRFPTPETFSVGDVLFRSSSSSSTRSRHGHSNAAPASLTRRGAAQEALMSATSWCAAAAAAGSLARNGLLAAWAEDGESGTLAKGDGNVGASTDQFGSKEFTKKSYDGFAEGYDDLDGGWAASALGTEELRSQLLSRATGRVLEVGVGTGLNLRHYRRDLVSAINAVDLSPGMLNQAALRSDSLGMRGLVKLTVMDVERLGFPADSFDTVVDTFSLCVFSDPSAALREMARVCKPAGRVLLLENSKSELGPIAAYQDFTASYLAEKGGAKGCFWNQDVEALCRGAGLEVLQSSPALVGGLFRTLECVPAEN